jgi:hypothetical protein
MQHVQPGYSSGQDNIEPTQSTLFGLDDLGRLHRDDVVVLQPLEFHPGRRSRLLEHGFDEVSVADIAGDEAFARLALG